MWMGKVLWAPLEWGDEAEASRVAAESTFSSQDQANCGTSLDPSFHKETAKENNSDVSLYTLMQELKKKKKKQLNCFSETSLAVHWLRLCVPNAGGVGSVPSAGTKIPDAANHSLKK